MSRSVALVTAVALLSGCNTLLFPTVAGIRAHVENEDRKPEDPEALVGTSVLVNLGLGLLLDVTLFAAFGTGKTFEANAPQR